MKFRLPVKTDWMLKQMEHEPTRAYAEDIYKLARMFPFDNALEIGCAWGISTMALLLGSPNGHLTSVDKGYYQVTVDEVRINGLIERWKFIQKDSGDYWQAAEDIYDLVYIDGDHSYKMAHVDMIGAWGRLKPGGVMLIDDAAHKNNRPNDVDQYGVSISAMEHWVNNPDIEECGFEGRILWFKKP